MSLLDMVFSVALIATLVAIANFDFRKMIIPDVLNALLAALGLSYAWIVSGNVPLSAITFSAFVFAAFWLVRSLYRKVRSIAGLGLGDVKMAAASALWFSPWNLPLFMFVASFSALIYVIVSQRIAGRFGDQGRVPFGPFIGLALLVVWTLERTALPSFIPDGGF